MGPSPMADTLIHSSTARFAHAGIGTVRICFPFPISSTTTKWSSRIWEVLLLEPDKFGTPSLPSASSCVTPRFDHGDPLYVLVHAAGELDGEHSGQRIHPA
jgi:hypothetical protein